MRRLFIPRWLLRLGFCVAVLLALPLVVILKLIGLVWPRWPNPDFDNSWRAWWASIKYSWQHIGTGGNCDEL